MLKEVVVIYQEKITKTREMGSGEPEKTTHSRNESSNKRHPKKQLEVSEHSILLLSLSTDRIFAKLQGVPAGTRVLDIFNSLALLVEEGGESVGTDRIMLFDLA